MADTVTSLKFEDTNVYDVFKQSTQSNCIDTTEYNDMSGKALESELMIIKMIESARNKPYNFSEIVLVTKKARINNELG
eukprot:11401326-Ditylum_brightwellii.AAC.1